MCACCTCEPVVPPAGGGGRGAGGWWRARPPPRVGAQGAGCACEWRCSCMRKRRLRRRGASVVRCNDEKLPRSRVKEGKEGEGGRQRRRRDGEKEEESERKDEV